MASALQSAARTAGAPAPMHLDVNGFFSRMFGPLGLAPEAIEAIEPRLRPVPARKREDLALD